MTGGSNFSRLKIFQLLLQLLGSRPACDFRRVQSTPAWSRSSQLGSRCWVRRNTKYIFLVFFLSPAKECFERIFCSSNVNFGSSSLMLTFIDHFSLIDFIPTAVGSFVLISWDFFLLFNLRKPYLWRRNSPQATLIMRNREELRTKHQSAFLKSHGKKPTVHLWRDPPIQTLPLIQ